MTELKSIHKLDIIKSEVKKKTGKDIDNLKPTFLERRILYRMRILGIKDHEEYIQKISTSVDEAKSLYVAFSINVTKFFRDPQVWEKLEKEIMPKFLTPVRFSSIHAWSCGSASGEEPHSISMLLKDTLKQKGTSYQVYANDISPEAIARAKKGIYRDVNLVNVNSKRLNDYFNKTSEGQYEVIPEIKNQIEYENIDMMNTKRKHFDIIFCRNVLIYYDKDLHETIFKKFSEMLKKDGILILGQDESMVGTKGSDFFETLHSKERIYQKKH